MIYSWLLTEAHEHKHSHTYIQTHTYSQTRLQALHGLPVLHSLDLEGNPIASMPGYRQRAILELAALQTLDGGSSPFLELPRS